jgi:uncharacterized membrane protein
MRFGDYSWLFLILVFAGMFFLRGCGFGGCCGAPRFSRRSFHDSNDRNSEAIEILNKRYASGEIDSDEYKRKKDEILGK